MNRGLYTFVRYIFLNPRKLETGYAYAQRGHKTLKEFHLLNAIAKKGKMHQISYIVEYLQRILSSAGAPYLLEAEINEKRYSL